MNDLKARDLASEQDLRETIEVVNESMPSSDVKLFKTQKKRPPSE